MTETRRRVIAHLDIDAFYASVELRRRPELRGLPLIVAGSGPRAVVTTASYEARRFGVDSAMPAARARALCPDAVVIAPDFEAYRRASSEVWGLVRERVEVIQQAGIDEAYLDLSEEPFPIALLRQIVATVAERTAMTVSVGIGPSRLVAKTASASFKPAAFVAMSREQAVAHFARHSTRVLGGVGPKTAERLAALGIKTVGELQAAAAELLAARFGERMARELLARAHFEDSSPVEAVRIAKSRSSEVTFPEDVSDSAALEQALLGMAGELGEGLRARGRRARTIAIKVRLDDWTTVTRARTVAAFTDSSQMIASVALELLRGYAPPRPVRLLGVRVASFEDEARAPEPGGPVQLALPL
ncbi:MAG TPA: DNA polymerase IV [Solirubrobacteraceae bacterium]|nr:DNA polymerase IV [Solirubrobacteraceae bacterium]